MGQVRILVFCTLVIFLDKIHAENFKILKKSSSRYGKPAIYGKEEVDRFLAICEGNKHGTMEFTGRFCATKKFSDDWSLTYVQPWYVYCLNHQLISAWDFCPSYLNIENEHNCRSISWLTNGDGDSLKQRLKFVRYSCIHGDGSKVIYDYYAALSYRNISIPADAELFGNMELKIFSGSSKVGARSRPNQVVNLFASETIVVRCRLNRGLFQKPSASPIKVRHINGSFIDIGPAYEMRETWIYWEYSYQGFVVDKEMTGISCSGKKPSFSRRLFEEQEVIGLRVAAAEFPLVIRSRTSAGYENRFEVQLDTSITCQLLDLVPTQKEIFLQTIKERGVNFKSGKIISFIGFSRMVQLAKEMDVMLSCENEKYGGTKDIFVKIPNPYPEGLSKPVTINKTLVAINRESVNPIRCDFTGQLNFSVVWLQNDKIIQFSWGLLNTNKYNGYLYREYGHHYSTLDPSSLPKKSSGLSYADFYPNISCVVSNYLGSDRHDFVTATFPEIRKHSTVQDINFTWRKEELKNITMACIFKGGPTTFVKWTCNGIPVDDSAPVNTLDRRSEYSRSELTTDLSHFDGGTVQIKCVCKVSNSFGRDTLEFRLFGRRLEDETTVKTTVEEEFKAEAKVVEEVVKPPEEPEKFENYLLIFVFCCVLVVISGLIVLEFIKKRTIKMFRSKKRADDEVHETTNMEEQFGAFLPPFDALTPPVYPAVDWDMELEELENFLPSAPPSSLLSLQ